MKNISFNPEKIDTIFGNNVAEIDSKKIKVLKKKGNFCKFDNLWIKKENLKLITLMDNLIKKKEN